MTRPWSETRIARGGGFLYTARGRRASMAEKRDEFLPTRSSLLVRLRNWDDQEGWRGFFETDWKLIYGAATKAGLTDAEAQDVVQETMLTVAKKMPGFKYDPSIGSFKGWLLQLTHWRIIDQLRKRRPADQPKQHRAEETRSTATI